MSHLALIRDKEMGSEHNIFQSIGYHVTTWCYHSCPLIELSSVHVLPATRFHQPETEVNLATKDHGRKQESRQCTPYSVEGGRGSCDIYIYIHM